MARLRILLALMAILIISVVTVATVLSMAELLAAVGNAAAASAFRYVGLAAGSVAAVTLVLLTLWIAFVLALELLRGGQLPEQGGGPRDTPLAEEDLHSASSIEEEQESENPEVG